MQKRIRSLYVARDIPYEGPVFITLKADNSELKVGDEIQILKPSNKDSENYELFGFKREDIESNSFDKANLPKEKVIQVINDPGQIAKGTKPGFRIYDRVHPGAFARVMFILNGSAIAVIEDWGIESYS